MHITILDDANSEHKEQLLGLISMIASRRDVEVAEIKVNLKWRPTRRLLADLSQSRYAAIREVINLAYEADDLHANTDLVVSAGEDTNPFNIAFSKRFECPNIQIGPLDGIEPKHFSAHLSLTKEPYSNAIATGIVTCQTSPDKCREASVSLRKKLGTDRLWCFLAGNSAHGLTYTKQDWTQLAQAMNSLADDHGIRWIVKTFRDSDERIETWLQNHLEPTAVAHASYYHLIGGEPINAILGAAQRIFCTADSINRLSEAVSSGRPVTTLVPEQRRTEAYHQKLLDELQRVAHLYPMEIKHFANYNPDQHKSHLDYNTYQDHILDKLQELGAI